MTELFSSSQWLSSPKAYWTIEYEYRRSGQDMQYRFKWKVWLGSSTSYYYNGLQLQLFLNGVQKNITVKSSNSNEKGWSYTGTTSWYTVSNKISGTVPFYAKLYDTSLSKVRVTSSSYNLVVSPAYATVNHSLKSKTETSITMNWSSDSTVDYVWFSIDNGTSWAGVNVTDGKSGSYTISGLSPNRSYQIKTRVRRKDSQLTTDSSILGVMTYNYPYCNNMPNHTIGNDLTLKFYNPLNRTFHLDIIGADGVTYSVGDYNGTSVIGFSNASWVNNWYKSIPNSKSGTYKVKVTYGSSTITKTGGTYSIKGNEIPSINPLWYDDSNPNTKQITGNTLHIVQNLSNLLVTYTEADGNNYASISKYTFELNGVKKESTAKGGSVDFGKINSATDLTLTMTVTDSRGLTAQAIMPITMLAHSNPTALVTLERLNNYEDESYLTIDGSVSSVNGKNTMEIKYRYKESGGSYNSFVIVGDKEKQTFDLDKNKSYIFNVVITDAFGSTYNKEHILDKGVFPLFIDTKLNSIGINKLPTEPNALEIEGKILGTQNRLLWSGESHMNAEHKCDLAEPISKQTNGIVLVFAPYSGTGEQNHNYITHFVSKHQVSVHPGGGFVFPLFESCFGVNYSCGTKYLRMYDQVITGNVSNVYYGTSEKSGIKYDNTKWALRYVIGV